MLELDHITLARDGFRLRADFRIAPESCVAVLGASGSGKSTLLSVIAGFDPPDSGRIHWRGEDITDLPPGRRPVSMVFQDNNLFPHLDVTANVGLGLVPSLRLTSDHRARISAVLEKVGLSGFGARKPAELSGGQQGRVTLARTLIRDKPLLLLDEPFSALGPALKVEMLDLLSAVTREAAMTVLIVSHDPSDALRIADQTLFIEEGAVHPPEDTKTLFADPPEGLRAYLGT